MPYIPQSQRKRLNALVDDVMFDWPTAGQVNYFITTLLLAYLGPDPCYEDYNRAIGVLECTKLEMYRRAVAPYENKKCKLNGDVY